MRKRSADLPLTGDEVFLLVQDKYIKLLSSSEMKSSIGTGKVIEKLVLNAGQSHTFDNNFTSSPIIIPIPTWNANQQIIPYVKTISKDSVLLGAKRTRSTLLLSSGPFEEAPDGTPVEILIIES